MWPSEAGFHDDDSREIQRQREAYARELDHQIALRREVQQQEQREIQELERKLAPSDRSPCKWLVEGGQLDPPTAFQPRNFTQSMKNRVEQRQDRGAATGEANSVSSSHPRFRVTDESETSQRVRERAQQMQWKRMLDDQVKEKARLKEQEEAERRRSEEDAAKEEVCYLRDQQLRAQRRLGQCSPAPNTASIEDRANKDAIYHALQPGSTANRTSNSHNFAFHSDLREEDDSSIHYQRSRRYDKADATDVLLPPPVPSRIQVSHGDVLCGASDDNRNSFARGRTKDFAIRQEYPLVNETQAFHQQLEQQSRMIEEYRSLLAELRREREELRRERDEMRREKKDLRVQRALLQLENEKMTSLANAQRALNEQYQADLRAQQVQQAQKQAQHQPQLEAQQEDQLHAQYHPVSLQHQVSSIRPAGFKKNSASSGFDMSAYQDRIPGNVAYFQRNQIRQSLGKLDIHDDQHQPAFLERQRKPPSPMSMAEFSALTPQKCMNVDIMDTSHFQRLSRYQPISAVLAEDESLLNQSLIGESVLVPLSPQSKEQSDKRSVPRTTISPTSADRQGDKRRTHPFQSSRVITSRGFYDFEQNLKSKDRLEALESRSFRGSVIDSDLGSNFYGDDDEDDGAEEDFDKHDDNRTSSSTATKSGLFQVQVLV